MIQRVSPVLLEASPEWQADHGKTYLHWCPGCKELHPINIEKPNFWHAIWTFDGNLQSPTFNPSINIVGRCHYFIRSGKIEFCGDSRHALRGQTVPLPEIPEDVLA